MESQGEGVRQRQSVVLIQDAYKGVNMIALRWIIDGFSLKAGDVFTLISVLHQIHHPMGCTLETEVSMFGASQKAMNYIIASKKKEYEDNTELDEISKLYETREIDFKIEFVAGPVAKQEALQIAKKSSATWVILDRKMKREKNYFLEKLSCGISALKRHNKIEKIRGPKQPAGKACMSVPSQIQKEVILPTHGEQNEDPLSSEFTPSSAGTSSTSNLSTRTSVSEGRFTSYNDNSEEKIRKAVANALVGLIDDYPPPHKEREKSPFETTSDQIQTPPLPASGVQLDQKICTTCDSRRPTSSWQTTKFFYQDLVEATNRFSSEYLIYRGEYENVFRGKLRSSKLDVMIKELKDAKRYKSEMQALEKTRHGNVIMLLGTCLAKAPRFLVFEYACNGSLDQHLLHQSFRPLRWEERINIALGASKGLNHLHEHNIIHGDVRPKNMLLTHDFKTLIAGFGLAKTKPESNNSTDHYIIGTFGYLAPEYTERGKATTKTDVYAYGVVLLELITGRSATDPRLEGKNLPKWARPLIRERKLSELVETGIEYDNHQVISVADVAVDCLCKDPLLRISMDEVVSRLEYIKDYKSVDETKEIAPENPNTETSITHSGETQKVNEEIENLDQHIQNPFGEEINMNLNGMTPIPKQAKHYFQFGRLMI